MRLRPCPQPDVMGRRRRSRSPPSRARTNTGALRQYNEAHVQCQRDRGAEFRRNALGPATRATIGNGRGRTIAAAKLAARRRDNVAEPSRCREFIHLPGLRTRQQNGYRQRLGSDGPAFTRQAKGWKATWPGGKDALELCKTPAPLGVSGGLRAGTVAGRLASPEYRRNCLYFNTIQERCRSEPQF